MAPSGFSHILLRFYAGGAMAPSEFSQTLPFLVVNAGSILVGPL